MANNSRVIVVDIEATCWLGRPPEGMRNEILEIGAVCVGNGKILRSKREICSVSSDLSRFCTKLTGLTQNQVNKHGVPLSVAMARIETWLSSRKYPWMSWGNFDHRIVEEECRRLGVQSAFSSDYLNLKTLYALYRGTRDGASVASACKQEGLQFNGRRHSALADAKNAARVWLKMQERGGF